MIALPESLTVHDAQAATERLLKAVAQADGPQVTLDGQALVRLDTAAVAALLACRRAALAAGKTLVLRNVPLQLGRLAALYGVGDLLQVSPG